MTVGASYDFSRSLRFTANAGAAYATSQGGGQALYAASAGASYVGDAIALREYEYNWSVNSALSAAGRSGDAGGVLAGERENDGSTFAASGSFTHSIGRAFQLPRTQVLGAVLSQTVTAAKATNDIAGRDDLVRLATDLSLTYSAGAAPLAGYARLTLTDSRSLVRSGSVFQMANFQLSATWEFSRYSRLTGDLSAQWVSSDIPPRRLLTPEAITDPRWVLRAWLRRVALPVPPACTLAALLHDMAASAGDRRVHGVQATGHLCQRVLCQEPAHAGH